MMSSYWLRCLAALLATAMPVVAQDPAPAADTAVRLGGLLREGQQLLQREDPIGAWRAFRSAARLEADPRDSRLGLGQVHLMLGSARIADDYALAMLAQEPRWTAAMALRVRALIRGRHFDEAVSTGEAFVAIADQPDAELLAAQASALFRVQRIDDAASAYRAVLQHEPLHAEAHLRLGSGLSAPCTVTVGPALLQAVRAARAGDLQAAQRDLQALLQREPDNPVAHRLLGDVLFLQKAQSGMAAQDAAFRTFLALLPQPEPDPVTLAEFLPSYAGLSPARRAAACRALALFHRRLGQLVAVGARHDLLGEVERTTDAEERQSLRGKRTFDGRVWDDVRGIGGMRAATGIEALDEAAGLGFDTLAHEVAHQVHYYALPRGDRARIRELYQRRCQEGRFLDFYAASNEAEYFAQGVEAFAALVKRPACETTHGHTRFELWARDRELHDFIAGLVDFDPLRDPQLRPALLAAVVEVAIRSGRCQDAVVAAEMLAPGPTRTRLQAAAAAAMAEAVPH